MNKDYTKDNPSGTWDSDWVNRYPRKSDYEIHMEKVAEENRRHYEEKYGLKPSLTEGAYQLNWATPAIFPLCPANPSTGNELAEYESNLSVGKVFSTNEYKSESVIVRFSISKLGNKLVVLCKNPTVKADSGYVLASITFENGVYVHKSLGSFFEEIRGIKYFTIEIGEEWTGGEVFDDFC